MYDVRTEVVEALACYSISINKKCDNSEGISIGLLCSTGAMFEIGVLFVVVCAWILFVHSRFKGLQDERVRL